MQRTAHGNTVAKLKSHDDLPQQASLYARGSSSPRPRDVGEAAGAVTRGDIRLPQEQRSEDRRKGGLTKYQYDLFGNLLRVDLPDGRAIEYDVDGAGRRVGRRELDAEGFEISFRGWIYRDLLRPIAEVDALGNVVARYVYARNRVSAEVIIAFDIDGSIARVLRTVTDQTGTPKLVVDVASGEVVERVERDSFGKVLTRSGSSVPATGFLGGLEDVATGLIRLGARDLDPGIGRWTTRDPIYFAGRQLNLYSYAANEPIGLRDPNGLGSVTNNSSETIWVRDEDGGLVPVEPGETHEEADGFFDRGFEDAGSEDYYRKTNNWSDVTIEDSENGGLTWDFDTIFDRWADGIDSALRGDERGTGWKDGDWYQRNFPGKEDNQCGTH